MFGDALIDFSHHIKTDFLQKQPRTVLGLQGRRVFVCLTSGAAVQPFFALDVAN